MTILGDIGCAFAIGFADGLRDAVDDMGHRRLPDYGSGSGVVEGRVIRRRPSKRKRLTANESSGELAGLGAQMIQAAEFLDGQDLPIEWHRTHGLPLADAISELQQVLAEIMRDRAAQHGLTRGQGG